MSNATATVTATITVEAAEHLTDSIRKAARHYVAQRDHLMGLVREAQTSGAADVLGMTWPEYVSHTLSGAGKGLSKADCEDLAVMMAGEGVSTRVAAEVTGLSQSTVARKVRKAEGEGTVKSDREVTSKNGSKRKASTPKGRKPAKAKPAKTDEKADEKAAPTAPSVGQADTDTLGNLAKDALVELMRRWDEGDEAAEMIVAEVATVINGE